MDKIMIDVTVNGRQYTETDQRAAKPCSQCGKPTQGRIERKPFCLDCGMKEVMMPLKAVGELVRGLLKASER